MLNLKSKFNHNMSKLLISISILSTTIGLASCAQDIPNSEVDNPNRPEQVQDASSQQTQPGNPPSATTESPEDLDKIKQQEEGKIEGDYNQSTDKRADTSEKQDKDKNKPEDSAN